MRDCCADRRIDRLQLFDRRLRRRMDAGVDLGLVLAEVADNARMVGRERVRRLRHAPRARHTQRLALQPEVPFECMRSQLWMSNVKHKALPPAIRSPRRWIRGIRLSRADPRVRELG